MRHFGQRAVWGVVSGAALVVTACGGGAHANLGGGSPTPTAATVLVEPTTNGVGAGAALPVQVLVNGSSSTATGTVILSSGAYQSSAASLTAGSANFTVPPFALAVGNATLRAAYTPDTQSASTYMAATGSSLVSVGGANPAVTVSPSSTSINTAQNLESDGDRERRCQRSPCHRCGERG